MAKAKIREPEFEAVISARVHCKTCGVRLVREVRIKGTCIAGVKTETECPICKKDGKIAALIFDRRY